MASIKLSISMSRSVFTTPAAAQHPSRWRETWRVAVAPPQPCVVFLLITQPQCRNCCCCHVSYIVFCSCILFLTSSPLRAVSAMTVHRPSLTSAALHPYSFSLNTIYPLREAKWCFQRHPLGVGQRQISTNCIFLLLFVLSTADLEITRFKIRRHLSSPVCMRTGWSSREIAGTTEKALFAHFIFVYCLFLQVGVFHSWRLLKRWDNSDAFQAQETFYTTQGNGMALKWRWLLLWI